MLGQTISQYTILEKLGEGGMGVVYKAQDTKLNRIVALKFLPDRVNADESAKARFLQEAQAAAGLNHSNICTIFGVEEHDAKLYMSMEYVEGGTIASKIPFTKTDDALAIAAQIADALQEAHAKGIVHRDIKADNIMLTSKGQVKVMDFGLAKLKGAMKLTRTSSTVGTLGYMAPEQIQGGEVDHRSDIFSFGVLLFEMLAGKLPFRGEHEAAMLYSIVNEEPLDISSLVPDIPPIVVNLIQRCLEKDPAERYQHFDDITADLKRALRKTSKVMRSSPDLRQSSPKLEPMEGTSGIHPKAGFFSSMSVRISLFALVVLAAAAGVWKFMTPALPAVNQNMTTSVLQIPATEYQYPDMSRDGKWLTFPGSDVNGKWDIYLMFIETGETRRLTSDSAADLGNSATSRFSFDGSSIVYSRVMPGRTAAEVCIVSVLTGASRVVVDSGIAPTWGPKGDRIYFYRSDRSVRAPSRSGRREYWSITPQGTDARIEFIDSLMQGVVSNFTLKVSTDGKRIMFTRPLKGDYNEIFIRDLVTGEERQITNDKKTIDEAIWSDNGYIIYSSNRSGNYNLWAVPEQGGEPVQVTRGTGPDFGISYAPGANRLIFSQRTETSTLWRVNTDGSGSRQLLPDDNIGSADVSPDNTTLALEITSNTTPPTVMIRDFSGSRQELLAPFRRDVATVNPRWSPSGNLLGYVVGHIQPERITVQGHIVNFAAGRRVTDIGEGFIDHWLSDSIVIVIRNTSKDPKTLAFNESHLLNLNTGVDSLFFREKVTVMPALNNSAIVYMDTARNFRMVHRKELLKDPASAGTIILRGTERGPAISSTTTLYFFTPNRGQLWKMDLKSLVRTKIMDMPIGENLQLDRPGYSEDFITYTKQRRKTNIVKIDNLFVE